MSEIKKLVNIIKDYKEKIYNLQIEQHKIEKMLKIEQQKLYDINVKLQGSDKPYILSFD